MTTGQCKSQCKELVSDFFQAEHLYNTLPPAFLLVDPVLVSLHFDAIFSSQSCGAFVR